MGIPARYVVGYLESSNNNDEATHAWAELYFKNVGWIAFDPTHNCCTNEKYVRICSGFDSLSAAPIRGVAIGSSEEKLNIKADFISKSAKLKIEKAGGVISILKEKA